MHPEGASRSVPRFLSPPTDRWVLHVTFLLFPIIPTSSLRADHRQVTKGTLNDQTWHPEITSWIFNSMLSGGRNIIRAWEQVEGTWFFSYQAHQWVLFQFLCWPKWPPRQVLEYLYWVMQIPNPCYATKVKKWGKFSWKNPGGREMETASPLIKEGLNFSGSTSTAFSRVHLCSTRASVC